VTGPRAVRLIVNGADTTVDVEPRVTLVTALRDHVGLTGSHTGCEMGACGACTVLLDGEPARACLVLAVQCADRRVVTIEGWASGGALHALQEAWRDVHAFQCGFCTAGFLPVAWDLLATEPEPDEAIVRSALSGNLCRCTGYEPIVDGVLLAAARLGRTPVPPPACEAGEP